MPRLDISEPIGVVKIKNKRGSKMASCGTPVLCVIVLDFLAPMDKKLLRSAKYDFNHKKGRSVKPNGS